MFSSVKKNILHNDIFSIIVNKQNIIDNNGNYGFHQQASKQTKTINQNKRIIIKR